MRANNQWCQVITKLSMLLGAVVLLAAPYASAQQSSSAHYSVNEVFFGNGGELNACSTTYCAKQALGELGVGNTKSTSYQAQGGFNTDRAPYLAFSVAGGGNLGVLNTSSAGTITGSFSVKTYLAGGYTVKTQSDPPTNAASSPHALNPITTTGGGSSSSGTEQFGINLVANTSPTTFGANPVQNPDNTFSFGTVSANYANTGKFYYNKGDIIASSSKSSGETDYVISYLLNISNLTPAGQYTMNHVLVATSTF